MRGTFCGPCPKSTAAQSADANATSHCVLPLDFYVLLLFEVILAAHVRTKDLGNIDAAVGVQVVLEKRDKHTRGSDDGVVERVGEIELAVLAADADLQAARLRVAEILRLVQYPKRLPCPVQNLKSYRRYR